MILTVSNYQTAQLSGMAIGAVCDQYFETHNTDELIRVIKQCQAKGQLFRVVGGGNNTIFAGERFAGVVIQHLPDEIAINGNVVNAEAGADWDHVVDLSVQRELSGIESLSLIPGTVAGAVVQNIGAYGQQLADTLDSVEVLDTAAMKVRRLTAAECDFAYRSSIFKTTDTQALIILSASLVLSDSPTYNRDSAYRQIRHEIGEDAADYTPGRVRETVLNIRRKKFPDQNVHPNCGSFFKNPVVSQAVNDQIVAAFGDQLKPGEVMSDATDDGQLKIRLAFVFDKLLGLNSQIIHGFTFHESNPLIVINDGGDYDGLRQMVADVQSRLDAAVGAGAITLTPEPDIINQQEP